MLVFEQFEDPSQMPPGGDPNAQQVPPQDPLAEITPLKKYYLSQRLVEVRNKLLEAGVSLPELDILLQFQNELSYEVLMILADKILSNIEKDVEQLRKDSDKNEI